VKCVTFRSLVPKSSNRTFKGRFHKVSQVKRRRKPRVYGSEWHLPNKREKQATRNLTYVPKDKEEMMGPEAI